MAVMEEGRDDGVWQKRALHYCSTAYLIDQFAYGRNQFGTVIDVLLHLLVSWHPAYLLCYVVLLLGSFSTTRFIVSLACTRHKPPHMI